MRLNYRLFGHGWLVWGLALGTLGALLGPEVVYARAGGGGGFGGGGGGGGGDGIPIELVFVLVRLCIEYPALGVPVSIGTVAVLVLSYNRGRTTYQGRVIRRGVVARHAHQQAAALGRIRAGDPGFDEDLFGRRVRSAFGKIQAAWAGQDLRQVRAFISDGIHERFSLQFQEQRELGYRNQMDSVTVKAVTIVQLESSGPFDVVTVEIEAAAADYRVALADGRHLSGSKRVEPFVEYWSFLRRHGVRTDPGRATLIEGNCPNCGSAIAMNQSANCQHCGAVLRSGQYDWVLAEITQASEWTPSGLGEIPGVAALRAIDPGFNVQQLEDRASVIFWRRAMADRKGSARPLRKVATAEFCEQYEQRLRAQAGRAFIGDCAVGAVETAGVWQAEGMERAVVAIRWAGTRFEVEERGQAQQTERSIVTESLFVLGRKAGVQTEADRAVSSAHCPNCGAPEMETASAVCEFCGEVLNDGARQWVLMDVVSVASAESRALLESAQGNRMGNGHGSALAGANQMAGANQLAWMVRAALVDGHVGEAERKMLGRAAARRRVSAEQLEQMISAAAQGGLELPEPRDPEEKRRWLDGMIAMAMADGAIHRAEAALLRQVAERYGFGEYDLRIMMNRQRTELLAEARAALRRR